MTKLNPGRIGRSNRGNTWLIATPSGATERPECDTARTPPPCRVCRHTLPSPSDTRDRLSCRHRRTRSSRLGRDRLPGCGQRRFRYQTPRSRGHPSRRRSRRSRRTVAVNDDDLVSTHPLLRQARERRRKILGFVTGGDDDTHGPLGVVPESALPRDRWPTSVDGLRG